MEVLGWFLFEAFGAATLVALVVWWSWPRRESADEDNEGSDTPPK